MATNSNESPEDLGLVEGTIVQVTREGRGYKATTSTGVNLTDNQIKTFTMKNAFRDCVALQLVRTKSGGHQWRKTSMNDFDVAVQMNELTPNNSESVNMSTEMNINKNPTSTLTDTVVRDMISRAMEFKPEKIQISELWWKFALRAVLRGENILAVGPSGCGKTLLARSLAQALGRQDKFFYVNLGSSQDPRSTLIGNTHFDTESGTYVALSYFARAIQTPDAIVLLDEASRAHPEAQNILMTVLDRTQRYMRVDEKADTETISVAPGVSFILTANIGSEYTAARTMDRAFLDRCVLLEMAPLDEETELRNLISSYPAVSKKILRNIAKVAGQTRKEILTDDPKVDTIISTRAAEQWAALVADGFTYMEAAEVCVFPFFSDAGGADCPRVHIKQIVQRYADTDIKKQKPYSPAGEGDTPWMDT